MTKSAAESFVPFDPLPSPTVAPDPATRIKVLPKAESRGEFAPLQGAPGSSPSSAHSAHATHATPANAVPVVTLQKEGERVTGIRIECSCGQVIELACSYADQPK